MPQKMAIAGKFRDVLDLLAETVMVLGVSCTVVEFLRLVEEHHMLSSLTTRL
jgi:hypothetical protein